MSLRIKVSLKYCSKLISFMILNQKLCTSFMFDIFNIPDRLRDWLEVGLACLYGCMRVWSEVEEIKVCLEIHLE